MPAQQRQFRSPTQELVYYQSLRDPDEDVVVYDGQQYRYQSGGPDAAPLATFEKGDYIEVSRLRRHDCEFGDYPWDQWQAWALADGVEESLAQLGRDLIREADQHNWPAELQIECGWEDSGAAMLRLALTDPQRARRRWENLLRTDGGRGSYDEL